MGSQIYKKPQEGTFYEYSVGTYTSAWADSEEDFIGPRQT